MTCKVGNQGMGICPIHGPYITIISKGANTVLVNGQPGAIVSSMGVASCGDPTIAQKGSPNVNMEGKKAHRLSDQGANLGQYIMTTDSSNVKVNNK